MFIYFADWTSEFRLKFLSEKGAPLGGRIIKAYASPVDPSLLIGKQLGTFEVSAEEFGPEETFNFGSRFDLSGLDLEDDMCARGLLEDGKKYLRALFRFGNTEPVNVIEFAMEIAVDGRWYFEHPLDPIHGISEAVLHPQARNAGIHIDIFTLRSLSLLEKIVDCNDPNQILDERETVKVIRKIRAYGEGNFSGKERDNF